MEPVSFLSGSGSVHQLREITDPNPQIRPEFDLKNNYHNYNTQKYDYYVI